MAKSTSGMGAEVSVRKIDEEGEVVQEEGAVSQGHARWAYAVQIILLILSVFGIWHILILIQVL